MVQKMISWSPGVLCGRDVLAMGDSADSRFLNFLPSAEHTILPEDGLIFEEDCVQRSLPQ